MSDRLLDPAVVASKGMLHWFEVIQTELSSAELKHPDFPRDIIHQVAIMCEEAGESLRAALQCVYEGQPVEHLEKELVQTGAMVFRILKHMEEIKERLNG